MIEYKNIFKKFNARTINEMGLLEDFSLNVAKGDFLSIIGSNGSGKTTLLNLLAGSLLPDSGRILIDGEDVTFQKEFIRARKIGRVFQDTLKGCAGDLTLAQNLSLAENKGGKYNLASAIPRGAVERYKSIVSSIGLGLEDKMNVRMSLLSGGQRQAVSLLMATMTPIDILILDEHTAALDPKTADIVMRITNDIVRKGNFTTMMVTHNLRYALEYGNRLLMMHEGRIILDKSSDQKVALKIDDILSLFNTISIECGN